MPGSSAGAYIGDESGAPYSLEGSDVEELKDKRLVHAHSTKLAGK